MMEYNFDGFADESNEELELYVVLQVAMQELYTLCVVAYIAIEVILKRYIHKYPRTVIRGPNRLQEQMDHINRLVRESDITCIEQLRMDRRCFMTLCHMVCTIDGLGHSKHVTLEEKMALFLYVLAHDLKVRKLKFNFFRFGETVSRHFNDVLKVVLRLQGHLLRTPNPITQACTDPRWNCCQNCLGALDGTYIKVCVPVVYQARNRTRKGEIATNVLGVCSQDTNFIYVLPGWEGSAADSRVLRDAINRPNGLRIPTAGATPTNYQEFFNMKHASARNVIERCFGLLKIRWAILTASYYPIRTQNRIITACCLLHNLIRREMPVDPIEERLNNDIEDQPQLGDDFVDTVETSNEWTGWWDTLAMQLYNNWLASMDSEVSSSRKKVKEKVDPSKLRRLWSPREEQCLINALMHIAGYLMKLEEKLLEMLPGTNLCGTPHIESKIKIWKKHYNCVAGMLGTSGFGWNDTEKRIDVEKDCRESDTKNLRNKSFPYFDSWNHIFGKDRATEEFVEGSADAVDAINAGEELLFNSLANDGTFLEHMGISSHIGEGINCSSSSSQRPPESSTKKNDNKKRPKGNDDVVEGLFMIANKLGEVFSATNEKLDFIGRRMGYEHDLASKRASLNDELIKLPITLDERLDACEIISQSAQKLDMFFSLTHDDKLRWVMRLLHRSAP
ncbi:Protein ALP1-like [Camellia lanceoleosa]|uniref:Protein ALP1-like n=1 Tax=Camellia lanceoleosa TaxID=1840588 RepID=A0ACC0FV45_9ERIC|nr:Protein ALP1-like [Camellia lanceoleosa]